MQRHYGWWMGCCNRCKESGRLCIIDLYIIQDVAIFTFPKFHSGWRGVAFNYVNLNKHSDTLHLIRIRFRFTKLRPS
jgi:hypothetical protein